MRHRVFIAINLPEDIKEKLTDYQAKWPELPIRWTKKDNLHITLMFLGYLSDEELLEVLKSTKEAVSKHQPFFINLKKIIYGPPKKLPPRMIWAEGEKSKELGKLQKDLENSLLSSEAFSPAEALAKTGAKEDLTIEARPYAPHITLGRIKAWEFRKIEPEEKPEVNEEINLNFEVNSIEVMESELKRGGAEYAVLESAPLKS